MLARAHRIVRGDDFRRVVRRGRRTATSVAVIHCTSSTVAGPRFGVIVSSQVGNAVHRNRVRRRIKAICATFTVARPGHDIVIRALPAAVNADWDTLRAEIESGLRRAVTA